MVLEKLKFDEKPLWQAVAAGLGVAVVIAGLAEWRLLNPKRGDIEAQKSQLASLTAEIEKGRAAERKLSQFREEVKRLELELQKLLTVLPPQKETEDLIKKVEALVHQGDFSLKSFKTAEPVPKEFYKEYPIHIALEGTYHNLALFFDRMSKFSRIINVEDLKMGGLQNVPGKTMAATFTAKTFIYTGDQEATGAGAPGKPGPQGQRPNPVQRGADAIKGKGAQGVE
jgi:type IV pilus assembly protein PilO